MLIIFLRTIVEIVGSVNISYTVAMVSFKLSIFQRFQKTITEPELFNLTPVFESLRHHSSTLPVETFVFKFRYLISIRVRRKTDVVYR